jgi:ABC-type uncharacterized transport system substrate-binding protein
VNLRYRFLWQLLIVVGVFNTVSFQTAIAHPHVWITMSQTILFTPEGQLTGVQHRWVFDEAYSAFAVQGVTREKDGRIGASALAPLAKSNTTDLKEFNYFTTLKSDGKSQEFSEPKDYTFEYDGKQIIYIFTLPLKEAVKPGRTTVIEITDPTYFVSFSFADISEPASLNTSIKSCAVLAKRPPEDPQPVGQPINEAIFNSLGANNKFGLQFASRIILAC